MDSAAASAAPVALANPSAPDAPAAGGTLMLSTAELPASTELLAYYRTRIGEFERDLEDAAKHTSAIEVSHEELHRTQWELKVRHEEVAELQRALSDANVYLFDEREQVLKLQAENDQVSHFSILQFVLPYDLSFNKNN